jgi:secondary thiamine-phosphate synthase enzyme
MSHRGKGSWSRLQAVSINRGRDHQPGRHRPSHGFPGKLFLSRIDMPGDRGIVGHATAAMPAHSFTIEIRTRGKGTYEITREVARGVAESGVGTGTVTVFVRHTSASLVIMENADPSARRDLETFFEKLVPEDTPWFTHTLEGGDDMPSHIRMALTRTSEVVPVIGGRMALGTWQGIFLFEHRRHPHQREIACVVQGPGAHPA